MIAEALDHKTILLIDDDPHLCQLVEQMFRNTSVKIISAYNGKSGLQRIAQDKPDLILLDLMMPHMDGWTTIRHIRKHSNLPVIIVSALGREKDVIRGLQIGADDFIVKPISQKMLLARVQANLRRVELSALATPDFDWRDDYLRVNIAARHVSTAGQQVELSPTEFELLAYLVHHAGETRTFTQILAHVWGDKNLYHTEYVHVYISRLRQKLEENPKEPVYLCSVHGIGYRFT